MRSSSPQQPLVSRSSYGEGQGAVAESGLPKGEPAGKGVSLDSNIPGAKTFAKPVDDVRDFDKAEDQFIYRVDGPGDLLKDQSRQEINEDNADKHDGIGYRGEGEWDSSSKTKYPYRDGIPNEKDVRPNEKSASSIYVLEAWLAGQGPTLKLAAGVKVALRAEPIIENLNPKYEERGKRCTVKVSRVDRKNLRWIFSVECGNGPKVVKIKASRKGNITKFSKMDLDIKCSCPAWRWQGPEHWAKKEKYLDGSPRGTASIPVIRDPSGVNRVCKHVASVLSFTKQWDVAK